MLFSNILLTGAISSIIFTFFVILTSVTGIAAETRDENGVMRKQKSVKAKIGLVLFLGIFLGIQFCSNWRLNHIMGGNISFFNFWINAFGTFLVVHLFDLVVLDILFIVWWHPRWAKLPDTPYYNTIKPHAVGFLKGLPLGVVSSLVVALLSVLIFNR